LPAGVLPCALATDIDVDAILLLAPATIEGRPPFNITTQLGQAIAKPLEILPLKIVQREEL
jgi:hypothetical protein